MEAAVLYKPLLTHRHRIRTSRTYYNNTCVVETYCIDCRQPISREIYYLDSFENTIFSSSPIGAAESTQIS
jgi:hypothetical protein